MSVSRCLQLCTPVKVCWESLTQFPPPSPCVCAPPRLLRVICLRLLTPSKMRLMTTLLTVCSEGKWKQLFQSGFSCSSPHSCFCAMLQMGTVGLFIGFVIHLCFSEAAELCGNIEQSHERPSGDCTGATVKVCTQCDHIPGQQHDRALVYWRK